MRMINADKALEAIAKIVAGDGDAAEKIGRIIIAVTETPAEDAVPVVRCKDCVYYETGKDYFPYCNHADGGIADYPQENDFCSYGERKAE